MPTPSSHESSAPLAKRLYLSADSCVEQRLEGILTTALRQFDGLPDSGFAKPFPQVLAIDCDDDHLRILGDLLQAELNSRELEQITCHVASGTPNASESELMRSRRLSGLVSQLDGEWVLDMIGRRKLITYYQPIVNTSDPSDVFGYECLTRGTSDEGSVIAPYLLFGRAKKAGLLNELDQAAYLTAIQSIAQLNMQDRFLLNVCPAVANSPQSKLRQMLEATASSMQLQNQIVIEVTESERIDDDKELLSVLSDFRSAGVRLALDDLGSGYSSLSLLAELKPEIIKIDMTLVRGASHDPYRACIVRKLIEMAKELDIQTVAEGVETVDDWRWASDNGADFVQGFLFARPEGFPIRPAAKGTLVSSGDPSEGGLDGGAV